MGRPQGAGRSGGSRNPRPFANPFPVKTGDQTVPLLVTAPNANSGQAKPAAGWPVVIFGHGITRSRADALAMADAAASAL